MTNMTIDEFRRIHEGWKCGGFSIQKYCVQIRHIIGNKKKNVLFYFGNQLF